MYGWYMPHRATSAEQPHRAADFQVLYRMFQAYRHADASRRIAAFSVQLQHVAAGLGLARSLGSRYSFMLCWRSTTSAHQSLFECRAAVHIRQRAFGMGAIELARSVFQIHVFRLVSSSYSSSTGGRTCCTP
ncbi:hypothetical protein XGA_4372, partial [Xanthomonas hortorum ATCC 19865]